MKEIRDSAYRIYTALRSARLTRELCNKKMSVSAEEIERRKAHWDGQILAYSAALDILKEGLTAELNKLKTIVEEPYE